MRIELNRFFAVANCSLPMSEPSLSQCSQINKLGVVRTRRRRGGQFALRPRVIVQTIVVILRFSQMRLRELRREFQSGLGCFVSMIQPAGRRVLVKAVHIKLHLGQRTISERELRVASNSLFEQMDSVLTIALKKRLACPQIEIIREHVFSRPVFDRGFLVRR